MYCDITIIEISEHLINDNAQFRIYYEQLPGLKLKSVSYVQSQDSGSASSGRSASTAHHFTIPSMSFGSCKWYNHAYMFLGKVHGYSRKGYTKLKHENTDCRLQLKSVFFL